MDDARSSSSSSAASESPGSLSKHCSPQAEQFVRASADMLSAMSDAELSAYIVACGKAMLAAGERWQTGGLIADKGERDGLLLAERAALQERGKRAQLVGAMERERGLT
jgi:hypothetical protein